MYDGTAGNCMMRKVRCPDGRWVITCLPTSLTSQAGQQSIRTNSATIEAHHQLENAWLQLRCDKKALQAGQGSCRYRVLLDVEYREILGNIMFLGVVFSFHHAHHVIGNSPYRRNSAGMITFAQPQPGAAIHYSVSSPPYR